MTIIHPLLASRSAPNYRQSWRLAGVWRRAINLMTESGELLTLHRQGSGFGPGGWVLRRAQFDALCGGLCGNERPQVVAQGIRLGRFTVKQPQRYCLLRITPPAHPQPLAAAWMQRAEETGLFGPLAMAASDPLPAELRQFRHCFQAALNNANMRGAKVNHCRQRFLRQAALPAQRLNDPSRLGLIHGCIPLFSSPSRQPFGSHVRVSASCISGRNEFHPFRPSRPASRRFRT